MRISVVIPALDEVASIGRAIESSVEGALGAGSITESIRNRTGTTGGTGTTAGIGTSQKAASAGPAREASPVARRATDPPEPSLEICVVDGGSRDGTVAAAREAAARVLGARAETGSGNGTLRVEVLEWGRGETPGGPAGRARQLQAGVDATRGDVLVMLHADTRLPLGWADAVRSALGAAGNAGGAFRFSFSPASAKGGQRFALWLVEWGARLRVAALRAPYGDQALFVRRGVLEAAGGVPQVDLMEDLDLVRIIKRAGRIALLRDAVETSPRRHLEGGVLRTAGLHIAAGLAYGLGVDRARIAGWLGR